MANTPYKYFLFSQQQFLLRSEVEAKLGRTYIPGKVMYKGRWRDFTEISDTPTNNKFADAKVITEGYLDKVQFKNATFEWKRRI